MKQKRPTIQVQSVIYRNEKQSLFSAVLAMANAVRVVRETGEAEIGMRFLFGDASPSPTFSEGDVAALRAQTSGILDFEYRFFGENTGSAKGNNRLAEGCDWEYILIMNPDVKVSPHFFRYALLPF